jgi:hypothetical protein
MGTLTTYAPLYFASHGVSAADVGVLMSLVQVMRIVGPTLWGWVADHSSRRVLVLRMTALGALAAFSGIALGRGFAHFFIAMVCLNLFTSAQGPLTEALMLAEMRGDTSRYGRVRLWGSLGFIAAVMAAGAALDRLGVGRCRGWPAPCCWRCWRNRCASARRRARTGRTAPPLLAVLRQPAVIAFFAQAALMVGAHTSLYAFYSLYLERAGYGKALLGAMWSLGRAGRGGVLLFPGRRAAQDRRARRDDGLVRGGGAALRRDRPGRRLAGGAGAGPAAARLHLCRPPLRLDHGDAALVRRAAAGARAGAVHEHRLRDRRDLRRPVHVVVLGELWARLGVWCGDRLDGAGGRGGRVVLEVGVILRHSASS